MLITFPQEYGYVILGGVAAGIGLTITGTRAGQQRKRLGVPLPALYADEARANADPKAAEFNRWQRGAMNALESAPIVLFQAAAGGLVFPKTAAVSLVLFGLGAVLYQSGYAEATEKRYSKGGGLVRLGALISLVVAVLAGAKFLGWTNRY